MTSIPNPRAARVSGEHPPLLSVTPLVRTSAGSPVELVVEVTNQAPAARVVHLQALGLDPAWLPAPYSTPLLGPGERHQVTLPLTPPTGTVPAQYPFVVTGQSVDAAGQASAKPALAETVILVNPRAQLRLELVPPSVTAWRRRSMNLRLTNAGTGTASVRLQPQSTGSVTLQLKQTKVDLGPGQTLTIPGRVKVLHPQAAGFRMRHIVRVEATGSETAKYAEGEVVQRPLLPPVWLKAVAVLAALAVWVSAGLVLLPRLTDLLGPDSTSTTISASGEGSSGDGGSDGSGGNGSGNGSGAGGSSTNKVVRAASLPGVQVNGTINADAPDGVTVQLRRTSLVDEAAMAATPVGSTAKSAMSTMSSSLGKIRPVAAHIGAQSAFTSRPASGSSTRAVATSVASAQTSSSAAVRAMQTGADGVWAFPGVKAPGFYLLTFTKVGFEPRSYVIDSASEVAAQPLDVDLSPGDGSIAGTITTSGRALGGATVTVSDGVSTLSTHTLSTGKVGTFSIKDLATPGTYVVTAARDGLSLESKVVTLSAGGAAQMTLNLRAGVATMTGRITASGSPVGGATVTVTDDAGRTYTSTSETSAKTGAAALQDGTAGTYHVPGLPAPGRYRAAVAAEGYLPLSTTLTLTAGQSSRTRNLDLKASTGTVIGQVTDTATPAVGLPNAGLILSNTDRTYKQSSTTSDVNGVSTPGFVEFDGVAPGTYQLSTELWSYKTATTTVIVTAGGTTTIAPRLVYQPLSEIAATGQINGSVKDAVTKGDLTCTGLCVTIRTTDPCPDDQPNCAPDGTDTTVHTVTVRPSDVFTLPGTGSTTGLRPGIHTVTISAPGYIGSSIKVTVPANRPVTLQPVYLYPAPTLSGTITVPSEPTHLAEKRVCVFAVAAGGDAPTGCIDSTTHNPVAPCVASPGSFDDTAVGRTVVCVLTETTGAYTMQVPTDGGWTMYVLTESSYYLPSTPVTVALGLGEKRPQDFALSRQGRALVALKVSDPTLDAVPAPEGSLVTVRDAANEVVIDAEETESDGTFAIAGLPAGNYTASGTTVPAGATALTGAASFNVANDTTRTVSVMLLKALPAAVGKVTTVFATGEKRDLSGATVTLNGIFAYDANGKASRHGIALTTGTDGCFGGLYSTGNLTGTQIDAGLPIPGICNTGAAWSSRGSAAAKRIDFLTTTLPSMTISLLGYVSSSEPDITWATDLAGATDPTEHVLVPVRRSWTQLGVTLPTGSMPSGLQFSVEGLPDPSNPTTARAMPGVTLSPNYQSGSTLFLTWKEGSEAANSFGPGTYRLTARAPGYAKSQVLLTCLVNGACSLDTTEWSLNKLGSLTVTVSGKAGASTIAVPGADVTVQACHNAVCSDPSDLFGPVYSGSTNSSGRVVFSGTANDGEEGLISEGYPLNGTGAQYFKVAMTADRYDAPDSQVVTLPQRSSDVSASFALAEKKVPATITVIDQYGGPVGAASVTMSNGTTTVTLDHVSDADDGLADGNTFYAAEVLPGTYTITVNSGALTNVVDYYVSVSPIVEFSYTVYVSRGFSAVSGTVTMAETPNSPIGGVTIALTCDPTSTVNDPALCDADGIVRAVTLTHPPLTTTTNASGTYSFTNVPNGEFIVRAGGAGWVTMSSARITPAWNLPTTIEPNFTLASVKQKVTLILAPSDDANDDLSGFKATLTPVSATYGRTSQIGLPFATDGTLSLASLQSGCYTVTFTKPTGHHGAIAFEEQSDGRDLDTTCAPDEVAVSGIESPSTEPELHAATVGFTLDEAPLAILVAVGTLSWHTKPAAASVVIDDQGTSPHPSITTSLNADGTASTLWLPAGTWTVTATPTDPLSSTDPDRYDFSTFWSSVAEEDVLVAPGTSASSGLTLHEARAAVTFEVNHADSLTLTPTGTDDPAVLSSGTNTADVSSGSATLDLPGGTYSVDVTGKTGYVSTTETITVSQTGSVTKNLTSLEKATYPVTLEPETVESTPVVDWSATVTPTGDDFALNGQDTVAIGTLPWGCWTIDLSLAASSAETRTLGLVNKEGPDCAGTNQVYIEPDGDNATITYTVTTP